MEAAESQVLATQRAEASERQSENNPSLELGPARPTFFFFFKACVCVCGWGVGRVL